MKQTLSLLIALLFIAFPFSARAENVESKPSVSAQSYVLYCADSSEILLSSDMDKRLGMASTTKIMTSLLTLEASSVCDKEVEFTQSMVAEGSSMYLKVGDAVRLSDLAAGMMTVSGNDAANAAAIAIGGTQEKFVQMMNVRAEQIGMNNTNFVNPSGLSHSMHYSTAYDLALLMAHAMDNEDFARLTSKESVKVDFVSPASQQITYNNHNRLLSMYKYCVGGKTGYTQSTGRCLVTCAQKDGLRLIAVTLNDRNDWEDHIALYEYGFENFSSLKIGGNSTVYKVTVAGADVESVTAIVPFEKKCVVKKEDAQRAEIKVYLSPLVFAPVEKDDVLGQVVCILDGKVLLAQDIIARDSASHKESFWLIRFVRSLFK